MILDGDRVTNRLTLKPPKRMIQDGDQVTNRLKLKPPKRMIQVGDQVIMKIINQLKKVHQIGAQLLKKMEAGD
jgi:hypothetical protein